MSTPRHRSFDELLQNAKSIQEQRDNQRCLRRQQAEEEDRLQQSFSALSEAIGKRQLPHLTDCFLDACRQFSQANLHSLLSQLSCAKVLAFSSKAPDDEAAKLTLEYALKLLHLGCEGGRRPEIQRLLKRAAATPLLNQVFYWLRILLDCNEPFRIRRLLTAADTGASLSQQSLPRPRWKDQRQLCYGDQVVKEFKRRAPNQFMILDAFEAQDWQERIEAPLDSEQLRETLKALNKALRSAPFHFAPEGGGRWIAWRRS